MDPATLTFLVELAKTFGLPVAMCVILGFACRALVKHQAAQAEKREDALLSELKLSRAAHIATLEGYSARYEKISQENTIALHKCASSSDQVIVQLGRQYDAIQSLPCQYERARGPMGNGGILPRAV